MQGPVECGPDQEDDGVGAVDRLLEGVGAHDVALVDDQPGMAAIGYSLGSSDDGVHVVVGIQRLPDEVHTGSTGGTEDGEAHEGSFRWCSSKGWGSGKARCSA
ncbi:hypothetical protein GCM10020219_063340 [Nonomuraea dietziae]